MTLLCLDTSHSQGSLCLSRDSQILELHTWTQEKSHAELVAGYIAKTFSNHKLKQTDIDAYVVNIGPGSFTGIRISINTIKTLSFVTKKPIYTFNSLETLAESCSLDDENLFVAINAHSDLCYSARFVRSDSSWTLKDNVEVIPSTKLNDVLVEPKTVFAGDAFTIYKDKITVPIRRPNVFLDTPSAKHLSTLALKQSSKTVSWENLNPFYVRLSSPEEKILKK